MGVSNAAARWTGENLDFMGATPKGQEVKMGKGGPSPSQLMLMGLAGCTGMDVVSILQKKRQDVVDVEVQVTAHNNDDYPKPYQQIELKFIVKGRNLDPKAIERAIHLSETKYCVVGQTLQNKAEITTSFEIEEPA